MLPGRFPKRRIADSDPSPVATTRPSGDQQRAELLPDRLRVGLLGIYHGTGDDPVDERDDGCGHGLGLHPPLLCVHEDLVSWETATGGGSTSNIITTWESLTSLALLGAVLALALHLPGQAGSAAGRR
ncbi:MAG TPA: hypothetical protein VFH30_02880 [Acidimicrobiales bacterium]|nr:hypothetical protein [Acidimicrobiales bacterium]